MSNTLELRSTFHLSDALSDIPSMSINRNALLVNNTSKKNSALDIIKSNKNAVSIHLVQTIKNCLDPEMQSILEPYSTKRFASIIRNSFNDETLLSISNNPSSIIGYDLGANKETCNRFKAKCFIRKSDTKGKILFHMPAFIPINEFKAPKEATNFKIATKLISISKFKFDSKHNQYSAVSTSTHGLEGGYETSMLPLIKIQTQPISANINIGKVKSIPDNVDTILVTAIKYYKYSNGKFEHLAKEGCLNITQIF